MLSHLEREDGPPFADRETRQQEDGGGSKVIHLPLHSRAHPKSGASGSEIFSDQHADKRADTAPQTGIRQAMADPPTREEIDAKLEAVEARTEARFTQLTGTIDVRFANLDGKIDRLVDSVWRLSEGVETARKEGRADNKSTRWTIIIVVIASVIAGLAALWATQGNMLSAFQAGLAAKPFESQPLAKP
jgi:hypothetical protein